MEVEMDKRALLESSPPNAQPGAVGDGPRAHLHQMWASVADAWDRYAEYADRRGALVTAQMLAVTSPQPGERVLELACGPGGVGLAAAPLVGRDGEVVLSDVVEEMTSIAARRAAAKGLQNIRTRVLELDQIDEPDSSYDVVLCREGLMFAADPATAAREICRVLQPGGRVAIAVWGPREQNPWLGILFDVVSEQLAAPVPPPGIPGPFSLADADRLQRLLSKSGITDVAVASVSTPLHDASFDEWWTRTSALAGPLARRIALLPDVVKSVLQSRLRTAVHQFETADGLDFPGVTLLATGRR
jgi:ubiquinone/menaquinone biosynthesis C-methylase UbiE